MKSAGRLSLLLAVIVLVGCTAPIRAPVKPPAGLLFTSYKAPLTTNFHGTPRGSKVGVSGQYYFKEPFFGTDYSWGDASVQKAAQRGSITQVHYVDYEYISVLGFFSVITIHVHGD